MNPYTLLLATVILLSSVTDLIRRVAVGSLTMQGVLTIGLGTISFFLVLSRRRLPKSTFVIGALVLFLAIGILSCYLNLATAMIPLRDQTQGLLVYVGFVGLMLLSAIEANAAPIMPPWYITDGFTRAAQICVSVYGVSLLVGGFGTNVWMAARSFSIFALFAVSWCLAGWRYRVFPKAGFWALLIPVVIACSYSRTATIVALVLFPLAQISPRDSRSWLRVIGWVGVIGLIAYLTFTYVEPIRNRFTEKGDNAQVGGIQVNTSGRDRIWGAVTISALESPVFGKGPGSVLLPVVKVSDSTHPHNDYLRLLHDFGWVGLGFWLVGYVGIMVQTWRNWAWAEQYDRVSAHLHQATLLVMVAMAIVMITDNMVVYQFVMAPLGILIGASIGMAGARRKLLRQSRPLVWMEDWSITGSGTIDAAANSLN